MRIAYSDANLSMAMVTFFDLIWSETCLNVLSIIIGLIVVTMALLFYVGGRRRYALITLVIGIPLTFLAETWLDDFYEGDKNKPSETTDQLETQQS